MGNPEGNSLLGRLRRKWENNIKMDLKKIWCGGVKTRTNIVLLLTR